MSLRLIRDEGDERDGPTGDPGDRDPTGDPTGDENGDDETDDIGGEQDFRRGVGLRLRTERLRRGLSQEDLGAGAGLTRAAVGKIERGAHKVDVWRLHLLSRVLGVELSVLLDERPGGR